MWLLNIVHLEAVTGICRLDVSTGGVGSDVKQVEHLRERRVLQALADVVCLRHQDGGQGE